MTEQDQVRELLERGVPEAPVLSGLADRVETGARRRRARRRAGGVVAALVAVAAVGTAAVVLSGGSGGEPAPAVGTAPAVAADPACRDDAPSLQISPATATPVAVRFCRVATTPMAVVPDVALTGDAVTEVARLMAVRASAVGDCLPQPTAANEVQISYVDGSARTESRRDCLSSLRLVLKAIADHEGFGLPDLDLPALTCDTPPTVVDPEQSFEVPTTSTIARLRADTAITCTGSERTSGAVGEDAEERRLLVLSTGLRPAITRCSPRGLPVQRLVLRLVDGSVHVLEHDPSTCDGTTLDGAWFGMPGPAVLAPLAP